MSDGIQSFGLLDLLVENDVAELLFLIGADLQQNIAADDRVVNLGVVQRLIQIVNFFGVDTLAAVRVVLDDRRALRGNRRYGFQDGRLLLNQFRECLVFGSKDRDLKEITSEAYRTAQEIKGKADAEAANIYAAAYNRDPDFYRFLKTMEVYTRTMDKNTILLLSTDGEFLRYLERDR